MCFLLIRSWLWCLSVSCWISSLPNENWAGWMTWCQSGRRKNWRTLNKRCNHHRQHEPDDSNFATAVSNLYSFLSSLRRSTVLLLRKKASYRCHWRETTSKSHFLSFFLTDVMSSWSFEPLAVSPVFMLIVSKMRVNIYVMLWGWRAFSFLNQQRELFTPITGTSFYLCV